MFLFTRWYSQPWTPYIHHSTPKMSSTRRPAATLTSCDRMLVSCVMAKTKTRSKNSSRVLTRSGASPSPASTSLVMVLLQSQACRYVTTVPAAPQRDRGRELVGAGTRGRDVRPGADRVQHPAARRHQGARGVPRGARVQQVGVVLPGPFGPYDLVALDRSLRIAFRGDHHHHGG